MVGSKSAFWQALVFTIIVFAIGLIFGFYLESSRASTVEISLLGSEINLLDQQLRGEIIKNSNVDCKISLESTFAFADKVYEEAVKLEEYESSSKFNRETMLVLHKRYDLLRTMFWLEAVTLKARCPTFHTVVYFFDYGTEDIKIKARQTFFSNLLMDVKNKNPGRILLIPIAADLDLAAVDMAMQNYKVRSSPMILIDEKEMVGDVITSKELEKLIFGY